MYITDFVTSQLVWKAIIGPVRCKNLTLYVHTSAQEIGPAFINIAKKQPPNLFFELEKSKTILERQLHPWIHDQIQHPMCKIPYSLTDILHVSSKMFTFSFRTKHAT